MADRAEGEGRDGGREGGKEGGREVTYRKATSERVRMAQKRKAGRGEARKSCRTVMAGPRSRARK